MEVVCLETKAFYDLIDEVVQKMMKQHKEKPRWLSGEEVMEILKISSKTTLQKLRDEGHIRFSQPMKRIIVYDRQSVLDYLDKHSRETF